MLTRAPLLPYHPPWTTVKSHGIARGHALTTNYVESLQLLGTNTSLTLFMPISCDAYFIVDKISSLLISLYSLSELLLSVTPHKSISLAQIALDPSLTTPSSSKKISWFVCLFPVETDLVCLHLAQQKNCCHLFVCSSLSTLSMFVRVKSFDTSSRPLTTLFLFVLSKTPPHQQTQAHSTISKSPHS